MHLEDDWESNVSRGSEVALTYGIDGPGRPLLEDENGQFQTIETLGLPPPALWALSYLLKSPFQKQGC